MKVLRNVIGTSVLLTFTNVAAAQEATAVNGKVTTLEAITVSANALDSSVLSSSKPVEVLEGTALLLRSQATLGDTLDGMPGIHADTFGAGASRPVIRGQTTPRIKILSNGSEIMDASAVSPDHAITTEPMLVERIEVLRGPGTLLYGGGAIGGVVNIVDKKVPTALPDNGFEGMAEVRAATGSDERTGLFSLTAGAGNVAVHVEGLKLRSGDYAVPDWPGKNLVGSFNRQTAGSAGISWVGDHGYLGIAYSKLDSHYGVPGHTHEYADCHPHGSQLHCGGHDGHDHSSHDHDEHAEGEQLPDIRLRSERVDVRGEYLNPVQGIERIRLRAGQTRYRHDEREGGLTATTFRNKGYDSRLEIQHKPIAGWQGAIGFQQLHSNFSSEGQEKYMPASTTDAYGIFLLEEYRSGNWRFEAGARHDWQTVRPDNHQPASSLSGQSYSAAAIWDFHSEYNVALSYARSKRLPNAQELYAKGVHLATNTYEIGNTQLTPETANSLDLTLRKHTGKARFEISVFYNQVENYIYGRTLDQEGEFRLLKYDQRDAHFAGLEASASYQFTPMITGTIFGDYVRARFDNGDSLPRIPAGRAGARLDARLSESWSLNAETYRVFSQNDSAPFESNTPGYTMVNMALLYDNSFNGMDYTAYVKATNLTNVLAYNHASFVSRTAPLPGRQIMLGVQAHF